MACETSTIGLLRLVRVATGLLWLVACALRLGTGSISAFAGGIIVPLGRVFNTTLGLPFLLGIGIFPFLRHGYRVFGSCSGVPGFRILIGALCSYPQIACPKW